MSQKTSGLRAVLSLPAAYEAAQRAIGSPRVRKAFVAEHVRPEAGQRLLDIGCGPGDILGHLPEVDYVGFDVSDAYIESARSRWGDRGRFFVGGVSDVDADDLDGPFDRVAAKGVLHHVDDVEADALFALAAAVVAPGGRVATIDPCFHEGQHRVARFVASRDRGQAVRAPEDYARIAERHFEHVESIVHTDLLRVPYSHAVVVATDPR